MEKILDYLRKYFLRKPIASLVFLSLVIGGSMISTYFSKIHYGRQIRLDSAYHYIFSAVGIGFVIVLFLLLMAFSPLCESVS